MAKISSKQTEVLRLMAAGWSLGVHAGVWLQRDGIGRGGPTLKVRKDVFGALCRRGLVTKIRQGFPSSEYGLSAAGRKALADLS